MDCLGLTVEELKDLAKGVAEKVALAWWLREGTMVSLRWVSPELRTMLKREAKQLMNYGAGVNHK